MAANVKKVIQRLSNGVVGWGAMILIASRLLVKTPEIIGNKNNW
jgi:hypothetical protein